jgi:hypothetical protein
VCCSSSGTQTQRVRTYTLPVGVLTNRMLRLHALPFLRILIATSSHSRVMSNPFLANRLIRAVIPYLTKSVLPPPGTKAGELTGISNSSKRKGKKRARGYEGDEVFKTSPGVLFASPHEERVAMLSVEGRYPSLCFCCEMLLKTP